MNFRRPLISFWTIRRASGWEAVETRLPLSQGCREVVANRLGCAVR